GDRGESGEEERDEPEEEREDEDGDRERQGCSGDLRELATYVPANVAAGGHIEGEDDRRQDQDGPACEVVRDRDDDPLDHGHPERETQTPLMAPADDSG